MNIYETLFARYGNLRWWPAETPYEVIAGAVLTQNTAWNNVEKAIHNFSGKLTPEAVSDMNLSTLADIIRPAGFFNQKAVYLKEITRWFAEYNFNVSVVCKEPLENIRRGLLSVKGVGKETADSILLYAFGFPIFAVDAYTVRLCGRYPIPAGTGYDAVKAYFEDNIPKSADIYNNFHAMIVVNAKEHCRKTPVCNPTRSGNNGCPLDCICEKHI